MSSKNISEEKDDNKIVRCENCRQDILAKIMFLHEGFCQRNNVFCEHCEEVYLKEDYKEHIEELKQNLITKKIESYSDSKRSTSNEEENIPIEHSITTIIPNPTIEYVQMPLVEQISINTPIIISENGTIVSNKNKNEYLLPYLGISPSQNNFFSGEEFIYGENQNFINYPYIETQTQNQIYPLEQYNNIYNNIIEYDDFFTNNTIKRNNTEIFNRNLKLNIFDDYNIINNNLINYNYNNKCITYNNNVIDNINEYNNKKTKKIFNYFKKDKIQRKQFNSEDKMCKRNKKYDSPKDKYPRKTIINKIIKKSPVNRRKQLHNYISFDDKKPTDKESKLLTEKRIFKKKIIKDIFKTQSISDSKTKTIQKCGYCQTIIEDPFFHFKECKKRKLIKSNKNKKIKKKINDKLLLTEKLKTSDIDEFGIEENNKRVLNRNFIPFLNISNLNSTINPSSPFISNEDINKKEKPKKIKTKKKIFKRQSPIINYKDNSSNKAQKPKKIIIKLKKDQSTKSEIKIKKNLLKDFHYSPKSFLNSEDTIASNYADYQNVDDTIKIRTIIKSNNN